MIGLDDMLAQMQGRPVRRWPTSAAQLAAAIGYGTWASAWQCDEASGTLADSIGSVTLSAAGTTGTPTYRNPGAFPGDLAVGFNAGEDERFIPSSTNTYDQTDVSSVALYLCFRATTHSNRFFWNKGASGRHFGLQFDSTPGYIRFLVADGTTTVATTISVAHHDGLWHDLIACIDRTNQRIQVFTDLGTSTEQNITSVTSLTNSSYLALGATAFSTIFEMQVAFAAVCNAGVDTLRASGATAVANIRRFTGRA